MGNCASETIEQPVDIEQLDIKQEMQHFYVICILFNPARCESLMKRYLKFKLKMQQAGVKLITVECAYHSAPFVVTESNFEPENIQIRTTNNFLQRENFINIALSKLPINAKYVAYIDCETELTSPNWIADTIKSLNQYKVTQMYEEVIFTNEKGKEVEKEKGFAAQLRGQMGDKGIDGTTLKESAVFSRYAWAFRVEALKTVKGLIDISPIGNNEKIMAYCLAQKVDEYLPETIHYNFAEAIREWQAEVGRVLTKGIGFVSGGIKVALSKYEEENELADKWEILARNKFDHETDLAKDENGIYKLDSHKPKLYEDLKDHFAAANKELIVRPLPISKK